jgi:D-xylose transport system substrate-binding protein
MKRLLFTICFIIISVFLFSQQLAFTIDGDIVLLGNDGKYEKVTDDYRVEKKGNLFFLLRSNGTWVQIREADYNTIIALKPDCVPISQDQDTGKVKIGLSFSDFATERWPRERDNMTKILEDAGYDVLVQEANHDARLQNDQIKNMVTLGAKVIIAVAEDGDSLASAVDYVAKKGVKVIAYDRLIKTPNIAAYVSFDNRDIGRNQAKAIIARVPKGNYVLLGGSPTDSNAHLFRAGQMEIIKPLIDEGDIKIVADQWVENWDPANSKIIMENIINATKGKIDAVVASNDGTACGAIEAMRAKGLAGKVAICGQDATEWGCNSIVSGELTVTIFKDDRLLTPVACEMAIKLAKKEVIPGLKNYKLVDLTLDKTLSGVVPCYFLAIVQVTKDNLKKIVVDSGYQSYDGVYGGDSGL